MTERALHLFYRHVVVILTVVPLALAFAVSKTFRHWLPRLVQGHQEGIYITAATVAATLLGFVITALSILMTVGEASEKMKVFREHRLYGDTLRYFHRVSWWLGLLTLLAIAGLLVDKQPGSMKASASIDRHELWIWLVGCTAIISVIRLGRCLRILTRVIELIAPPSISPRPPWRPSADRNDPRREL